MSEPPQFSSRLTVFRASRIRLILMAAASLTFAGLGVFWIKSETGIVELAFAFFATAFFGFTGLRGLYVLVSGRERLILDKQGFMLEAWSRHVLWHDVEEIFVASQKLRWHQPTYRYICINVSESWRAGDSRAWPYRLLSWLNYRMGFGYLTVATVLFPESYRQIAEAFFDAYNLAMPDAERDEYWIGLPYDD